MKNFNELLTAVANQYSATEEDVRRDLRTYFNHLMEDADFRSAWQMIPKTTAVSDEELLLSLMIMDMHAEQCTEI